MFVSSDLRLFSIWLIFCSNFVAEWGQWAWSSMVWQCQKPWCKIPGSDDQGPISRKDPWAANAHRRNGFFQAPMITQHLLTSFQDWQGWTNENWLKSRFHFNFAEYSEGPSSFGVLRVMNDDLVAGRTRTEIDSKISWIAEVDFVRVEGMSLRCNPFLSYFLKFVGCPNVSCLVTRIWRTSASRHGNYDLHCWWLPHAQGRSVDLRVLSHLARPWKRVSLKNVRTPWEPKRHWAVAAVNLWLQARKSDSNIIVDLISFV